MTDPIADMLTRIRNAVTARHARVEMVRFLLDRGAEVLVETVDGTRIKGVTASGEEAIAGELPARSEVIIHFDPTIPASKFMSAGFDLVLEDEIAPGVDLILSPLVVPNPNFPAHANCRNLR